MLSVQNPVKWPPDFVLLDSSVEQLSLWLDQGESTIPRDELEYKVIRKVVACVESIARSNVERAEDQDSGFQIIKLAEILSDTAKNGSVEAFSRAEKAWSRDQRATEIFKMVGMKFKVLTATLLHSLNLHRSKLDHHSRMICTLAQTQLILNEGSSVNLTATLWGTLLSIDCSRHSNERLLMISSIRFVVPYFGQKPIAITTFIELLSVKQATVSETRVIKELVMLIFKYAGEGIKKFEVPLLHLISGQDKCSAELLEYATNLYVGAINQHEKSSTTTSLIESIGSNYRDPICRFKVGWVIRGIIDAHTKYEKEKRRFNQILINGLLDEDLTTRVIYMDILGKTGKESGSNLENEIDSCILKITPLASYQLAKIGDVLLICNPLGQVRLLDLVFKLARKSIKFDISFVIRVIRLSRSKHLGVRSHALAFLKLTLPLVTLQTSNATLLWLEFKDYLLTFVQAQDLIESFQILSFYSIQSLEVNHRKELMNILTSLYFHPLRSVRLAVYCLLGTKIDSWRAAGIVGEVVGLLLLALGDGCAENVIYVVEQIENMGLHSIGCLSNSLWALKNIKKLSYMDYARTLEALSSLMILNRIELRVVIDSMIHIDNVDKFWFFFLSQGKAGVEGEEVGRPDEYDYGKNEIQSPLWISLIGSKFSIIPIPVEPGTKRDLEPTNAKAKRRYLGGFMRCLFPSLGSFDPNCRQMASIGVIWCCIRKSYIQGDLIKGLLEYLSDHLLTSKSAISILKELVTSKIPALSECIFVQYFDMAFEYLRNAQSPLIQIGVLDLLLVFCLVFPKGMNLHVKAIYDTIKSLSSSRNNSVSKAATALYLMLFNCIGESSSEEFELELIAEIQKGINIAEGSIDAIRNLHINVLCLGNLTKCGSRAFQNGLIIMPLLAFKDHISRLNALESLISLSSVMDPIEAATTMWIILPLFDDPNLEVRSLWTLFRQSAPSEKQIWLDCMPAHVEDRYDFQNCSWNQVLSDKSIFGINGVSIGHSLKDLIQNKRNLCRKDLQVRYGTHVTESLLNLLRELVTEKCGPLPTEAQNIVHQQLEIFSKISFLIPSLNLVLSEFAILHSESYQCTVAILLRGITSRLEDSAFESCILGVRNVIAPMSVQIMRHLVNFSFKTEGELLMLIYAYDLLNFCSDDIVDLVRRLCQITKSSRFSERKRSLACFLAVDLIAHQNEDLIQEVINSIDILLQSSPGDFVRERVYRMASKVLRPSLRDHALFQSMEKESLSLLHSKSKDERIQSLSIFSIFVKRMEPETSFNFIFTYLADPDVEISKKIATLIFDEGIIDVQLLITPNLKKNTSDKVDTKVSIEDDIFRLHYGLKKVSFKLSESRILNLIEIKLNGYQNIDLINAHEINFRALSPLTLLSRLIPLSPATIQLLINNLIKEIESTLTFAVRDVGIYRHKIAFLWNLLTAVPSSMLIQPWISRLMDYIVSNQRLVIEIRNALYLAPDLISSVDLKATVENERAFDSCVKSNAEGSVHIAELTSIAVQMMEGYSIYQIKALDPRSDLHTAFAFFFSFVSDESRSIRKVVLQSIILLVKEGFRGIPEFRKSVRDATIDCVGRLAQKRSTLYRKKVVYCKLIANMIPQFTDDSDLLTTVLKSLIDLFNDENHEIRRVSIEMITSLCEQEVKFVLDSFQAASRVNLLAEIIKLIQSPDYSNRIGLQKLLKYRK